MSTSFKKLLAILETKKIRENTHFNEKLKTLPTTIILKRKVENELIIKLKNMKALQLNKITDPSFGNAKGSDYNLFDDKDPLIKAVAKDLTKIINEEIDSKIYIDDSFYTILGAGGRVNRHTHLSPQDRKFCNDFNINKYSLVYYLMTGDQKCSEPGILKLYDPIESYLPTDGMMIMFPADREHSAKYNGNNDRMIIGVNFYAL